MSLLDNLIQFSNAKPGNQRASSLSLRTRFGEEDADDLEQPRTSSKSLSKPFNARSKDLLSASNMNDTGKALYKLTYILNKKLRAVRYFFFVKLETLKKLNLRIQKQPEQDPVTKEEIAAESNIERSPERVEKAPVKAPQSGPVLEGMKEKLSYLRQTFDMLYLKHFTSKTEEYVFKLIRNFSRKQSGLLNFASAVGRRTSEAILWSKKTAMNKLKNNEKDFLKAQLFFDLVVAAITTQQRKDAREAFIDIQLYGFDVARRRIEESERELELERQRLARSQIEAQLEQEQRLAEYEVGRAAQQSAQQQVIEQNIRQQMEAERIAQERMAQERAVMLNNEQRHREQLQAHMRERFMVEQQQMAEYQNIQLRIAEEQRHRQEEQERLMKLRLRSIEEEREQHFRQRAEEDQRIRERLAQEMKVRERLEQELKIKQKTEEQLRKRIRMDEESRSREKYEEESRAKQRIIEDERVSPVHRYTMSSQVSRNPEECQRVPTKNFDGESPTSNKKPPIPQIPPMRVAKQKVIEDHLRDEYSSAACTTEKSENLTPRVQSQTNFEYFQQKMPTKGQQSSQQKVPKKEYDEQVGRSQNKKKIVLSKRPSIDEGTEPRKGGPLKPFQPKNSSARCEITVKVNDSPIKTQFPHAESQPKAVYRQYPDQISKEIEDISDNLKLFMEAHEYRPEYSIYGNLQFSEVKSSNFSSEASMARHEGILSQISRLKEQEAQMKAARMDNPSKFTSPAQFLRSADPTRSTEQFLSYKNSSHSQQIELPRNSGAISQLNSPYIKHKSTATLALNPDGSRPSDALYISRRIKESCMDGSRKEEAQMQDPRQAAEARKRTDSETRNIRLTDPTRSTFDKSCSSDTKIRSIQMLRTVANPTAFTATHSLTPADAPPYYRRPNSEMPHLYKATFDLKRQSQAQQCVHPNFSQAPNPNAMSHTTIMTGPQQYVLEGVPQQVPHMVHVQPGQYTQQQPSMMQSEYFYNRSKQLVVQSSVRHT